MKISFTGDVVFCGFFSDMETRSDIIDSDIAEYLKDSDYCVCDIEGPVYSGEATTERVAIRSKPEISDFLRYINGNIWCLGNNHMFDYGTEGMLETLENAQKNGFQTFGVGKNIEEASRPIFLNSGLVGLLSIRYNNKHNKATATEMGHLVWDDDNIIKARIDEIKEKCRWCILVIHGGDEFCEMPLPDIRNRYLHFLDCGADIIIGHHPHVTQNYEKVGEKIIFYSIGNFVFDNEYMRTQKESRNGILLKLDLSVNSYSWSYMPVYIDGSVPKVVHSEKPPIFREIGSNEYIGLLPNLKKAFKKKERENLCFNLRRHDIRLKAKYRIIASHLLRYMKINKRFTY